MTLSGLLNKELQLILFGGKGGVGKTSCALATAISLSKKFKTLVISTDPAHSISDSLNQQIGNKITKIKGIENLSAIEINADEALDTFKEDNRDELKRLLDTSTNLDHEDIDDLMSLPIPGIDEVMSFKTIVNLIEEGKYEKYIVDTAPTGHAMRLINSPVLLNKWIKAAAKMRWKYRYMVTTFSGSYVLDEADDLLLTLKKTVKRIENILRDENKCEFIPVCIPESLSVSETNRLISELKENGISIRQLIINNIHESDGCSFCRERRSSQVKYIEKIRNEYTNIKTIQIPLMPSEVKGINKLQQFLEIIHLE